MIHGRLRLPLAGDQGHVPMRLKAKNKTFLRRENQHQVGGAACLPLVGPNHPKITRKETLLPPTSPPVFRLILR